jgi:hypothetical protein
MGKKIVHLFAFLSFVLILAFSSCNKQEMEVKVPSYIKIDSVYCQIDPINGTNKQKITDVWVNLEGTRVGTFQVPASFPIIAEGTKSIKVYPGIMKNGITEIRERHPYMKPYEQTINFEPLKEFTFVPVFEYVDHTKVWLESFEDLGHKFFTNDSVDYLTTIPDPENAGNNLGYVNIPDSVKFFNFFTEEDLYSTSDIDMPIYMEFDYKCTVPFSIGVRVQKNEGDYFKYIDPFTHIKKNEEWNKLYINLGEQFVRAGSANAYSVYFIFAQVEGEETKVYFDNFKILSSNL